MVESLQRSLTLNTAKLDSASPIDCRVLSLGKIGKARANHLW